MLTILMLAQMPPTISTDSSPKMDFSDFFNQCKLEIPSINFLLAKDFQSEDLVHPWPAASLWPSGTADDLPGSEGDQPTLQAGVVFDVAFVASNRNQLIPGRVGFQEIGCSCFRWLGIICLSCRCTFPWHLRPLDCSLYLGFLKSGLLTKLTCF